MKMRILFTIFFALTFLPFQAQEQEWKSLFDQAHTLYEEEKYQEAAEVYQTLEREGAVSDALYYNMGNVYYKLHQTASSIYYYEKALLLNPEHEKSKINLKFAQKTLLEEIPKTEKLDRRDIIHKSLNGLDYNQWAWMSIGFSLLIFLFFVIYYLSENAMVKRLFFGGIFLALVLCIGAIYAAYFEKQYEASYNPGIVFNAKTELKSDAKSSSKTVLTLHEGAKVYVLKEKALWSKVRLENQQEGWLLKESFKTLKP